VWQVNLKEPDLERFPLYAETTQLVVDLTPGEVLYLPPFWLHHVTALHSSVSVNSWCPGTLYRAGEELRLLAEGLIQPSWPEHVRTLALKAILDLLLKELRRPDLVTGRKFLHSACVRP
jgi:hypothetical protein